MSRSFKTHNYEWNQNSIPFFSKLFFFEVLHGLKSRLQELENDKSFDLFRQLIVIPDVAKKNEKKIKKKHPRLQTSENPGAA